MSAKLYLPAEIQAQILLEAFKIIAFPDFWRARAVNSFFASEIKAIVTESIQQNDGFLGFGPDSDLASSNDLEHRVRRLSLYYKAGEHPREPSVWSGLVDEVLAIPHGRTPEETDTYIRVHAHAWLCDSSKARWKYWKTAESKFDLWPRWGNPYRGYPMDRPVCTRMDIAFIVNAVRRGHQVEMPLIWDQKISLEQLVKSSRDFRGPPLQLGISNGSKEILQHLFTLKYGKSLPDELLGRWKHHTRRMVREGDIDGLKRWIEFLQMIDYRKVMNVNPAITQALASETPEILGLIQDEWEAKFSDVPLVPHIFREAVTQGSLVTVKWLCTSGRLNMNMRTSSAYWPNGPLHLVINKAPSTNRLEILEYLLKQGAAPDGPEWAKTTPFEDAVRQKDVKAAEVLLKHGATFEIGSVKRALLSESHLGPWFRKEGPCDAMAQILWPNGARVAPYKTKGKSYVISRDSKRKSNIEKVFLGLGWSEAEVQGLQWDYFIDVVRDVSAL
ncbi:hypothetical protein PENFLA_c046G03665 [Penicillium flavigenum]|uniref:Uncharacterized protein n=1 Tax=Penicillium flavigenum TaxID=254877 RepID=A0A1V6SIL1_9EURO|nr:hypothetical protein PENFLA_c046G03665 [Penicillium flavigenum]